MMDSQEKALEMGNQEEVNKVEENVGQQQEPSAAAEAPQAEPAEAQAEASLTDGAQGAQDGQAAPAYKRHYADKNDVLGRVKELAHGEEVPAKDEVDYLKTVFYKLLIAEREANLKSYIDGGGDPESFRITPDEAEEAFKAEMGKMCGLSNASAMIRYGETVVLCNVTMSPKPRPGIQGPAAGMEGNKERAGHQGQRAVAQLPAIRGAVLRHAEAQQRGARV